MLPPPAPHTPQGAALPHHTRQHELHEEEHICPALVLHRLQRNKRRRDSNSLQDIPSPSFHITAAESRPRGISCISIAPMHGVSARPSTALLEKGVRGVKGAERSRRHLPGGCCPNPPAPCSSFPGGWDHFVMRAALSTQPLPQKPRPSCTAAVYSCTPRPLATRSRRDLG